MNGAPVGRTVVVLGIAQALAWGSSYYLPAILARNMARDLGVTVPTVFGAFSLALVVSAFTGPHAGRMIDRWGGRSLLMSTNLVFAAGLVALALARGPIALFAAWIVIGLAMGGGLYDAAFATLVRLLGRDARNAITGIALIAGFASTVGWPLSSFLMEHFGWRGCCVGWAVLHIVMGLPLNGSVPAVASAPGAHATGTAHGVAQAATVHMLSALLLAFVFAASWFISTAMAAHLPRVLESQGAPAAVALFAAMLVGPAQVAGRLLEYGLLRRVHPLLSARLAALAHPAGAILLSAGGAPMAFAFTLLHGAGNGILTIAVGTLPLALFGPQGYGRRQGLLLLPARLAQAMAPLAFGLALDRWPSRAVWLSGGLGLLGLGALLLLSARGRDSGPETPQGATGPTLKGN